MAYYQRRYPLSTGRHGFFSGVQIVLNQKRTRILGSPTIGVAVQGAGTWPIGPWPRPISRACRRQRPTYALARRTASARSSPQANPAAIAADKVSPAPRTAVVLTRGAVAY